MRFLNRSAGRLSRHRRSRSRASLVLLLGLLLTGGLYTAFSPAQAEPSRDRRRAGRQGPRAVPGRLRLLPRPERRGHRAPSDGRPVRPVAGRRRRRRRRLPGRHRPDADGPARRRRRRARSPVYTEEEIAALAAYVASLGPGPAIPDESDYSLEGLSDEEREEAIVRGGQIFLTNCTACHNFDGLRRRDAARRLRPADPRRRAQAHLRGDADRPAGDADVFSDGNLTPEEKRDVIAYLAVARGATPTTAASAWAASARSPRACSPGSSASASWSASRSGSPPTRTRSNKEKVDSVSDHDRSDEHAPRAAAAATPSTDPIADPGLPAAPVAADRRRPEGRRSAPSARSRRCSGSRRSVLGRCFVRRLLRLRDRRRPRHHRRASAPPTLALGLTLGVALLFIGIGVDPVGPQADGRPRDRRDAPPRRAPPTRTATRHRRRRSTPASRSPASAGAR